MSTSDLVKYQGVFSDLTVGHFHHVNGLRRIRNGMISNRPSNISAESTPFRTRGRDGDVTPVDNPTPPRALVTSNRELLIPYPCTMKTKLETARTIP